jgi:hypothetical protein
MPPLTIIPILVESASASSILWVVRMTALFLSRYEILETTYHINLRASGSIPAEGSSSKIIGGLPNVAIATDNLRLLPPLKVPDAFLRWSLKFNSSIAFSTISFLISSGIPLIFA